MIDLTTLPNGVRIVSEPLGVFRSASVGIWVGVGSRLEKAGEEGSAHFIEHMLFKGTGRSSAAELARRMDAIGGQVNAFTTRDSTCFYARVLDAHLPEAIDILTEMFFDSLFDEKDVVSERSVVLEEIDMYGDTPEDVVVEQLMKKCFPGSLGKPVLGTARSLAGLTGEKLRAFKEREYTPGRIVVSVCGSFTDKDLARLAERFSALPAADGSRCRKASYAPAAVSRRRTTEQNHFCLAWEGLSEVDERRYAWQILSMILGGGLSSRLFQTVREKHGLCYSIGSFTSSYADAGLFGIDTAVSRVDETQALELIRAEVDKLCADGVTDEELRCARELMKSGIVLSSESTVARMNRMGAALLQYGRCPAEEELLARYDAVTAGEVLSLARELLTGPMSFSAVGRVEKPEHYLPIFER